MNDLIKKILIEADYDRDNEKNVKIKNVISTIENLFKQFKGEDFELAGCKFEYISSAKFVAVEIPSLQLEIRFFDKGSVSANKTNGGHYFHYQIPHLIKVYGCNFNWEESEQQTSHWVDLNFNKSILNHELVHYFDWQQNGNKLAKTNTPNINSYSTGQEKSAYYNHGVEFNAYFLQHVMPVIDEMLEKRNSIPPSFNEFKEAVLNMSDVKGYYEKLNSQIKKHFLKRLAIYYQSITEDKS